MRWIVAGLLTTALAACGDTNPTAPLPHQPVGQPSRAFAYGPLRDALDRITPSLGPSAAVAALQSALTAALEDRSNASLGAIESVLQRLEAEQPDAAVEADVIRLALFARP